MRHALRGLLVAAVLLAVASPVAAQSLRYSLVPGSLLITHCHGCDPVTLASERLSGTFEVGRLPTDGYTVDAVTSIAWTAGGRRITGSGFLQRFADGSFTMVIDARFNGVPVLLTSGRVHRPLAGALNVELRSPQATRSFTVRLLATPERSSTPDEDGDGVSDTIDNCPATASADQTDSDGDLVGDACDRCPDTPFNEPALPNGCALAQACPCQGPIDGGEWRGQRDYVQCVARSLKQLRQRGQLGRSEVRELLQTAVRSGCGRRALAMQ